MRMCHRNSDIYAICKGILKIVFINDINVKSLISINILIPLQIYFLKQNKTSDELLFPSSTLCFVETTLMETDLKTDLSN